MLLLLMRPQGSVKPLLRDAAKYIQQCTKGKVAGPPSALPGQKPFAKYPTHEILQYQYTNNGTGGMK